MPTALPEAQELRKHSNWFIVYGVILIILGILAIIAPGVASLAAAVLVGWLLIFAGVAGLIAEFSGGTSMPGFWWHLITSIVYVLAGVIILVNPIAGVLTLTLMLTAYLFVGGIIRIILAFSHRDVLAGAWGWLVISGIIDLVLAALIISGWPGSAIWIIGLMVGINLLMMGISIVFAGNTFRKMVPGTP